MDSTVSYVNIFIKYIKYSDIRGTISQEIASSVTPSFVPLDIK